MNGSALRRAALAAAFLIPGLTGCDPEQGDATAKAMADEQRTNAALTKRIEDLQRAHADRMAAIDEKDAKIAALKSEVANHAMMREKIESDLKSENLRFEKIVQQLQDLKK